MPQVPSVSAPTQTESGAPVNVSAPGSAFGATVLGEGLTKIGEAFQGDSDLLAKHAEQFQALNNKAEADSAFVTHLNQVNAYAANYMANNRGINAYTNLPAAMTDINKQRDDIAGTLSNPMSKAMFDMDSRRATSNITGELTRFAVSQRKDYLLKQSTAVQEALASDTVIHPDQFSPNMAKMMEQQVAINDQLGLSPEEGQLEARKLYGSTVAMVSKTLAGNGDIQGASAFLEAHKEGMDGKVYADTLMQLKPAMLANDAADIGHEAVQDALHGMGSSVGPTVDYLAATHSAEGTGKNPRSTAEGEGQFTNDTWLRVMKNDPQFKQNIAGKTDAQILALRHDTGIANQAILSYAQMNADALHSAGLPVNAATVGLAHHFGMGDTPKILNAAPNTPVAQLVSSKVMAANPDLAGKTAGQIVAGYQQKFPGSSVDAMAGGAPTSVGLQSRMQTVLALVDSKVQAKYGDNAVIRDQAEARAMAELNRQINAAKDQETNAYTTLGSVAMDSQVQDLPTLLKTVPNGLQMYNSLPLSQRTSLQADIHRNATEITQSRYSNINTLNGMYAVRATNPEAFLSADIKNLDLPLSQKIDFLKKQQDLRAKPASMVDPTAKIINGIKQSEQYKALVSPSGLDIKPKSTEEFHLLGTIAGQLDAWNDAHPNQPPGQKDIAAMVAHAAGQQKYHYEIGGIPIPFSGDTSNNYDVSDVDRTQAVKLLQKLGQPTDENSIARIIAKKNAEVVH